MKMLWRLLLLMVQDPPSSLTQHAPNTWPRLAIVSTLIWNATESSHVSDQTSAANHWCKVVHSVLIECHIKRPYNLYHLYFPNLHRDPFGSETVKNPSFFPFLTEKFIGPRIQWAMANKVSRSVGKSLTYIHYYDINMKIHFCPNNNLKFIALLPSPWKFPVVLQWSQLIFV